MAAAANCKDLEVLESRLHADIRVYSDFAARLIRDTGEDLEKAYQRAKRAKQAYEGARECLNQHASQHCCESEI
jgi:hypothetical protein